MPEPDSKAYIALVVGIIFLVLGIAAIYTGESWSRFGRVISRAKQPNEFWQDVAIDYIAALGFIGYFLYRIRAL